MRSAPHTPLPTPKTSPTQTPSYPISFIDNARIPCVGPHPRNVILLCCDAFGAHARPGLNRAGAASKPQAYKAPAGRARRPARRGLPSAPARLGLQSAPSRPA
jgi:hypothetical protein